MNNHNTLGNKNSPSTLALLELNANSPSPRKESKGAMFGIDLNNP